MADSFRAGIPTQPRTSITPLSKNIFGNPCHGSDWGGTVDNCKSAAKFNGEFLAIDVLRTFDINIHGNSLPRVTERTALCPLDIQTQDPFAIIRACLDALLLEGEYWEVYADEFGEARFVKILNNGQPTTENLVSDQDFPEIRFCTPGARMEQLADLVVVRGNTPVPEIRCDDQEIQILHTRQGIEDHFCGGNIFTGQMFSVESSVKQALGRKFSWGTLARSKGGKYVSSTCELGTFKQYGTVVYPEYDRKQVYKDNIADPVEIGPFQQIIGWMIDLDYEGISTDDLKHYAISFTSGSTEIPVRLDDDGQLVGQMSETEANDYFPPTCDLSTTSENAGCKAMQLDPRQASAGGGPAGAIGDNESRGLNGQEDYVREMGLDGGAFVVPPLWVYGKISTCLDFNDANRWGYLGLTDKCGGDPIDNLYQNTTQLMAAGFPLRDWSWLHWPSDGTGRSYDDYYFFGIQTEHQVIQFPEGENWVEIPRYERGTWGSSTGVVSYALRIKPPVNATYRTLFDPGGFYHYDSGWINPFLSFMGVVVSQAYHFTGSNSYMTDTPPSCWTYNPPGYLIGLTDTLWTLDENSLYAKINIMRPGIQIKSGGRDIEDLLRSISMKVKPLYQYSMQQPVAACGTNFCQIIDPMTGIYDNAWCTSENLYSDMEKLKDAMTGVVVDITLSCLFPTRMTDAGYKETAGLCLKVATDLFSYYNSFRNEPYKGYTYVCGPPKASNEIPRLGNHIRTPHGVRTINNISYNYQDGQSYTLNIEVGPAMITPGGVGQLYKKQVENATVWGKVIEVSEGYFYKVDIPNYGIVSAWNIAKWPWEVGDSVQIELYNVPKEL